MTTRTGLFTAIKDRLSTITVANGYKSNIGNRVEVMPSTPIFMIEREYVADGVVAFDVDTETYQYQNNIFVKQMNMTVQAVKPALDNQDTVTNDVLDDLLKALVKDLHVEAKIRILQSEVGFTATGTNDMIIVNLNIEITYKTNLTTE